MSDTTYTDSRATDEDHADAMSTDGRHRLGPIAQSVKAALGEDSALGEVIKALNAADQASIHASSSIAGTLDDDLVPEDARRRLAGESYDKAERTLKESAERSLSAATVLRRQLETKLLPKLPTDPASVAMLRDEARMVIEGANDPFDAVVALMQSKDRDLAAVLSSRWGRTYLRSKGVDDVQDAMIGAAAMGAAQHGDATAKAAAAALGQLDELHKAHVGLIQGASTRLSSTGQRIGRGQ